MVFNNKSVLKLHQESYIEQLLNKFDISNFKGIVTSTEKGLTLIKETNAKSLPKYLYRELVLMYLIVCTCPDLRFAVNCFRRF